MPFVTVTVRSDVGEPSSIAASPGGIYFSTRTGSIFKIDCQP